MVARKDPLAQPGGTLELLSFVAAEHLLGTELIQLAGGVTCVMPLCAAFRALLGLGEPHPVLGNGSRIVVALELLLESADQFPCEL